MANTASPTRWRTRTTVASFAAATALTLLLWSSTLPARAGGLTQPDGGPVGQTAADGTATDANAEPNTQPEPDTQPAPEADASVDGGSAPDAPAAPDSSTGTADHADDDRAPTADGDQRTGDRGGTQAHNPDTGRRGADRSANAGAPPATPAPQHSTRSNDDSATGDRGTGATADDAGAGSGDARGPESRASTADDESDAAGTVSDRRTADAAAATTDTEAIDDGNNTPGDQTRAPTAEADDNHGDQTATDTARDRVTDDTGHNGPTEATNRTAAATDPDDEPDGTARVAVEIEVDPEAWDSMTGNVDGTDVDAADDDSSQAGTDHPATDADASPDSAPGHGDTTPEPAAGADDAHAAADERKSTVTGRTGHAGRTERDDEPDDPTVRSTTKVAVSRDRESDGTAHVTVQIEVDAEAWASMTGESTANGDPSDARAATAEDEACDVPPHGSAIVHDDNVARTIVAVGQTVGASDRALLAALEAAIIESGVQNLDDGDDSLGVFQLRPSAGWGTSAQVTDPVYATRAFLLGPRCAGGADANSEPGAVTRDRTHEGTAGQLAHAVQRSASPRIYDAVEGEARAFLRRHRDADPKGTYALIPSILPSSGEIGAWGGYDNGRIPLPALASIGAGHLLRTDAAAAWIKLQRAATADLGHTIGVTDSYRSYEAQVAVKTAKGYLAATPGRSNHGWGLALDLDTGGWDGTAMRWLQANAHRFGWHHPDWARIDGSKPEHWHWEYGGTTG